MKLYGFLGLYLLCFFYCPACHSSEEQKDALTLNQGYPPFPSSLSYLSTEKSHPLTLNLSQVMHDDLIQGLKLLHEADKQVLSGFELFIIRYLSSLSLLLDNTFKAGGRSFLIGSGSSGRIAIDVAAKCTSDKVIGIIAGGDSAFIRAKEGFEDSEEDGQNLIAAHNINSNDTLFLLSASGSASFNVGCAIAARKAGACVVYFYNSKEVPSKTEALFTNYGVIPIVVDIGPQAISGSTRLQAATLAELCLACLFSKENPATLLQALTLANQKIEEELPNIAALIQLQQELFSCPQANFRRLKDETTQGYVTFLAEKNSLREVMIDSVEIPPTFSTNPPRRKKDAAKKMAEFQAFLLHENNSTQAWKALLGRNVHVESEQEVAEFDITENGLTTTLPLRPTGQGNLVIGVTKDAPEAVSQSLKKYAATGAKTCLIALCEKNAHTKRANAELYMSGLQKDAFGIVETVVLKQLLNMISNGSMIMLNKVHGNQMIDVQPSNKKLVDRTVRLVHDVLTTYKASLLSTPEELYSLITHICKKKKEYDLQNVYTPSVVKIAVTMIHKNTTFEEAIEFLHTNQEQLEKVFTL